ncbi:MAG: hypothetical protein LUE86_10230 [Clostridiales bacterium]|nr:hypothetical protein [Clostridiales bacterium]
MADFMELEEHVKDRFQDYREEYGIMASSTAYMEKHDHKEPEQLMEERKELFRELTAAVREGMREGLDRNEIRRQLSNRDIPMDYERRAERVANGQKIEEERRRNMTEERRASLSEEIIYKLDREQQFRDEFFFLLMEQERIMNEDKVRSMLEYGRHNGLTDVELIAIAVEVGIPHDHAEHLVENTLQDDVDRQFYRDEREQQSEYTEELGLERGFN